MTPQERLNAVSTAIRKALPRLLEDTNGCIFKDNWHGDLWKKVGFYTGYDGKDVIVLRNISNNEVFVDFDNTFCVNSYEDVCHTLIGHDILLTDVLEWLNSYETRGLLNKKNSNLDTTFEYVYVNGGNITLVYSTSDGRISSATRTGSWDLSKPRLIDQSENFWEFLYDIVR